MSKPNQNYRSTALESPTPTPAPVPVEMDFLSSNGSKDKFSSGSKQMEDFEIFNDANLITEDLNVPPSSYYKFVENCPEGFLFYSNMFKFMKEYEIKLGEGAGVMYMATSAIFLVILKILKGNQLANISTLNFLFIQGLVCLLLTYLCIRKFNLQPALSNDDDQFALRVNAVIFLVGLVLFIASWTTWPSEYSWLILGVLPWMEITR
jgi:hypothetical protein